LTDIPLTKRKTRYWHIRGSYIMVDVDAEAAFLSQLQAANENDGGYDNTGDASGQHIDSSDEYDPAQDVQDVSASGPQNLPNPSSFVDSSVDDPLSHDPTSVQHSLSPSTGMNMVIPSNSQVQDDLSAQPQTSARSSATGTPQVDNAKKPGPATQANMLSQSAASATPKARLPHDRIGLLEDRIAEDPKGDMDAWLGLINEHRKRGKLDEARKVYDRFFVVFPSAVSSPT
jgi:cleavage stimulation factor subunit 3